MAHFKWHIKIVPKSEGFLHGYKRGPTSATQRTIPELYRQCLVNTVLVKTTVFWTNPLNDAILSMNSGF